MNKKLTNFYINLNVAQLYFQRDYLKNCIREKNLNKNERIAIYKQITFINGLINSQLLINKN